MSEPLRGVNLGGWLVLEKWITPGLFVGTDAEDEYTFMRTPGAAAKLEKHRRTWITESDFSWLSKHGVNAVRIPVGYWLLDGDAPYISGALYLEWAFKMADKYGLAVLLDIHALPGSQNGNDHSGRIGPADWQKHPEDQKRSLAILKEFARRYRTYQSLWGIEVINEPNAGAFQVPLRRYYRQAYKALDRLLPPSTKIVYSDAWSPRIFAFILPFKKRAVMDVHQYHMATLGATTHSLAWYYRKMTRRMRTLRILARLRPTVIGEWSGVISGETVGKLPQAEASKLERAHYEFQDKHYAAFAGSFYWTYKIEGTKKTGNPNYWDYRSLNE